MSKPGPFTDIFVETPAFIGAPEGYVSIPLGLQDEVSVKDLAWAYGKASLTAISMAEQNPDIPQLAFPALFLARHAVELYVKGLWLLPAADDGNDKRRHRHHLAPIWDVLREQLRREHKPEVIERVSTILDALHRLDPGSMAFRYKDGGPKDGLISYDEKTHSQTCVNLAKLGHALKWLFDFFDTQWARQGFRSSVVSAMLFEAQSLDFDFSDLARELRPSPDPTKEGE